jgi:lysophospholipase L1-like esterase
MSICLRPLSLLVAILFAGLGSTAAAAEIDLLKSARRIVFLGDSITASGGYVAYLDAWLLLQNLPQKPVVINGGLSSETVSGLSEEGHAGGKFPRPDLFERLDRVLQVTKPDLVFACYGINCGIYQPFDEERFSRYRQGIERLKQKAEAAGAKVVIITPPFYDDVRKPLSFSYNEVLNKYAEWLVSKASAGDGWRVVDLHFPMGRFVENARRTDPRFTLQPDGVHPNDAGHWFIARQLLKKLGDPAIDDGATWQSVLRAANPSALQSDDDAAKLLDLAKKRTVLLHDAYVAAAGHKRPGVAKGLPIDEAEKKYHEISAEIDKFLSPPPAKP